VGEANEDQKMITRRKFIQISAASIGALSMPLACNAFAPNNIHQWQGVALGAQASLKIIHDDKAAAQQLIKKCFVELQRLEGVFSLFKADSSISLLNKKGYLLNPPSELVELLRTAHEVSQLTKGAFDVSIQPLWKLYINNFATHQSPPTKQQITGTLKRIGYKNIEISDTEIKFIKPNMAISLNGIAQGFITDKITDLLKHHGLANMLVNMGEIKGSGMHPDGNPWNIGVKHPVNTDEVIQTVELRNKAISTSAGSGTTFDESGKFHHLINPLTGEISNIHQSVSVIADSATYADALSTGFSMMPERNIVSIKDTTSQAFDYIIL
jgi:thiamine biosynthesis lipoprotein